MGLVMADGLSFEFPDLQDLIGRMRTLDDKVQKSISRRATSKGARIIRDKIRANASRVDDHATSNSIAKNVHVRSDNKLGRQMGGVAYRVGIRGGGKSKAQNESNPGGDTFYWRFLEFGTKNMAAKPFFRPAIEQTKQTALSATIDEAMRLINVEVSKLR